MVGSMGGGDISDEVLSLNYKLNGIMNALSRGAIFLATCNKILLLRDVN